MDDFGELQVHTGGPQVPTPQEKKERTAAGPAYTGGQNLPLGNGRPLGQPVELGILASRVSRSEGTDWDLVRSESRVGKVVKARRLFANCRSRNLAIRGRKWRAT
jgi:hypothetical protein